MAASVPWSRSEVSTCNCPVKSYRHVHCRCLSCRGRATPRATELRHWREACRSFDNAVLHPTESYISLHVDDNVMPTNSEEFEDTNIQPMTYTSTDEEYSQETVNSTDAESCIQNDVEENNEENPLRRLVVKSVLDAMSIMEKSGSSINTFEDILKYGKSMLLTSLNEDVDIDILTTIWPKNWSEVQTLLKEEGYSNPKEYYICICRVEKEIKRNGKTTKKYYYTRKWSIMESQEEVCPHCGNFGYIKYYYLGLGDKIKNWFHNKDMCKKMLSHWEEKEHWLHRDTSWPLKREIWDGKRWLELEWFWDPDSNWTLPTVCDICHAVISSEIIVNSPKDMSGKSQLQCPQCLYSFLHNAVTTKGSPLNLALIGHWDAWQPFSTSGRSCGSFEVSIANMSKKDRAHVEEVYVIGFVPCTSLPNDVPEVYDPFMQPLMTDLCDGFINGFEVSYPKNIAISNFQPNEIETVRVLLLCWAADHPGQCEIGKFLNQGKCPCRRCKLCGQQGEHSYHYYYGNNRYEIRHPNEDRDLKTMEDTFFDLDNETRKSVRKKQSSEKGFTGTSILHKYLYPLYGFDIIHHMVFDIFHTIPLNLCKNQVSRLLELELINSTYLDEQIEKFPWTADLKNGRVPKPIGKDGKGLAYWKAETFQKFAFPMLECIMENKLQPHDFEIVSLVSRFTELHFYSGRNGWTDDMIEMHRKLSNRLNVKVEESQGLEMCSISVHNMKHIHEDLLNFSSTDNYWCAVFERAVKDYVRRSHNCKGVEATFARAECRREYLKALQSREVGKDEYNNDTLKEPFVARSVDMAKDLCKSGVRNSILIGSVRNVTELSHECIRKIATSLSVSERELSRVALTGRKCFIQNLGYEGIVLSRNEFVIATLEHNIECVLQTEEILNIRCLQGESEIVFKGKVKSFLQDDQCIAKDDVTFWSGFPKVRLLSNEDEVFVSIRHIKRKVMLYKCDSGDDANMHTVRVVDYMRCLRNTPYEVVEPVYPEKDDMLLIQGQNEGDVWHGKVLSTDFQNHTVDVYFFVEKQQQSDRFVRESLTKMARNTVSLHAIIGVANGYWSSANSWHKTV